MIFNFSITAVEYIHELLEQRQALLARLANAQTRLPEGHPGSQPLMPGIPLWEREWTGGEEELGDDAAIAGGNSDADDDGP